jgi:signal transduction histidine kinase
VNRDDTVTFTVSDNGIGIPAEALEHIFDDFTQVETPLHRRLRGTGLGLALCRRLARLLGGDVSVESTVGVGSTFHVAIPMTLPERARLS